MTTDNIQHGAAATPEPVDDTGETTDADLRRYGITSRSHITYEWNGYRYTNSADAIAAAKRAAR